MGCFILKIFRQKVVLLCIITTAFLFNCTISPKYSAKKTAPLPERKSSTGYTKIVDRDKLFDAPSLKTIRGVSSWYGGKFHGRTTANGERYDMYKISAAHKEMPFNTWIRVTNLKNNKKLLVRINDRGPFIKGRILDLSYGAALELGGVEDGLLEVIIEVVQWGNQSKKKSN